MDDADLRARFNSIMTKGAKTNTYKFALAKFMLEYTDKFTESQLLNMADNNQSATVDYSDTAMEFKPYPIKSFCAVTIPRAKSFRVISGVAHTMLFAPHCFRLFSIVLSPVIIMISSMVVFAKRKF